MDQDIKTLATEIRAANIHVLIAKGVLAVLIAGMQDHFDVHTETWKPTVKGVSTREWLDKMKERLDVLENAYDDLDAVIDDLEDE